jgi:UDP-sugar transporter A1/2/3
MDDPKPATARIAVLAAMLFQNVAYTLLRRYSQGVLHETYSYAEVLVLAEIAKTVVAGAVACRGEETRSRRSRRSPRTRGRCSSWRPSTRR